MTTLLRQSSNLARSTTANIEPSSYLISRYIHRSLARTAYHSPSTVRTYASAKSRDRKDAKAKAAGKQVTKNGNKLGKPARGFEALYSDAGPLSHRSSSNIRQHIEPPPITSLSKAEQEQLDGLLSIIRGGLSDSQVTAIEKMFAEFKHKGIPPEVQEIMKNMKNHPLDVVNAARLVQLSGKWAREKASNTGSAASQPRNEGKEDRKESKEDGPKKNWEMNFTADPTTFLLSAFIAYMLYKSVMPSENSKDITFQEFKTTFFDKGLVDKLTVINRHRVRVDLHREATGRMYPESPAQHGNFRYYFSIGSVEAFERQMEDAQNALDIPSSERIPISYVNETGWYNTIMPLAPTLLLIAGIYWASRRAGGSGAGGSGGILGSAKAKPRSSITKRMSKSASRMSLVWTRPNKRSWSSSAS